MVEFNDTDAPDLDLTTADDGDSDEGTETPDLSAEPGTADDSDATDDGPPRDKAGRFAPKSTASATAASPDGEDGATATDDPDAPAAHSATAPTATPTATEEPAPEAPADQPYAFPHRGQSYAVEGAVVKPDGTLVVPPAARQRIDLLLTRGREAETFGRQREQDWQRQVETYKARAEQRDAGVDAFAKLVADSPDPETFLQRALEFYESLPALKEQQLRDEIERLKHGGAARPAPAQAAEAGGLTPEALQQSIPVVIAETLGGFRQAIPEFQGFTDDELRGLQQRLTQRAGLFVRQATAEDEARWGVTAGEIVHDADAMLEEARLLAAPVIQQKRQAAAKAAAEAKLAEAKKKNAAVLTKPKLEPVPRPGAESAGGNVPRFKSKDEYEAWLNE